MVAVLSKLFGLRQLNLAEDIVQEALLQALHTWPYKGVPDNPSAWLYRVARNKAVDLVRRQKRWRDLQPEYGHLLASEYTLSPALQQSFEEEEIADSQLRMIFACCHPAIPRDAQIALALKTLCGLSVKEIAAAFLKDEETIAKRIYRAKEKIRQENISLEIPSAAHLPRRLDAALHCLYLLFNEGYNSSQSDQLIREDLCEEAIRLAFLLTQNPLTNLPRTNALLALFCFQASRLNARLDADGNIVLLQHQDRSKWFRPLIQKGFAFLEKATQEETSIYHLEAAIAYLHAVAPNFDATNWKAIYLLYAALHRQHASPVVALNKAIAAGYAENPKVALKELALIKGLEDYHLYHTAVGEMLVLDGQKEEACAHFRRALSLTATPAERQLLSEKIAGCSS